MTVELESDPVYMEEEKTGLSTEIRFICRYYRGTPDYYDHIIGTHVPGDSPTFDVVAVMWDGEKCADAKTIDRWVSKVGHERIERLVDISEAS